MVQTGGIFSRGDYDTVLLAIIKTLVTEINNDHDTVHLSLGHNNTLVYIKESIVRSVKTGSN